MYTQNSIYEVDQGNTRVRRLNGLRPSTRNQDAYAGNDGWAPYLSVRWEAGGLLFEWAVESGPDGIGAVLRRTLTSPVVSLDGPPIRETAAVAAQ